ncbi:hypothetical protein ACFVT1_24060 [Streptomyces sp. NPDC057963]|uniref:hypothetical protein n=1 Tax=Streptomyces sp. NPDC057963 TaxID=3346290 RepID=UPI0036E8F5F6
MSRDPPLSRRGGAIGDFGGAAFRIGGTGTEAVCEAVGVGVRGGLAGAEGVTAGTPAEVRDGVADGCADVDTGPPSGTAASRPVSCVQPAAPSASAAISNPATGSDARPPAIPAPKNDHVIRGVA